MQQKSIHASKNKYSRENMRGKSGGSASGEGVAGIEGTATLEGDGRSFHHSESDEHYDNAKAAPMSRLNVSPADMRRAVLMSEILGKPLALRGRRKA